jgi:hypothetical protein
MYSRKRAYKTSTVKLSVLIKRRNTVCSELVTIQDGLSAIRDGRPLREAFNSALEQHCKKLERRLWIADGHIVKFAEAAGRHI